MCKKYKQAGWLLLAFAVALMVNGCFHYGFTRLAPGRQHWILPLYEVVLASLVATVFFNTVRKK